jgi:hypothetical protein
VGVEGEVFRAQDLGGLVVGQVVEQYGAQDGALGVERGGQAAFQVVVGGGQV